jgi:MFS family permease
VNISVPPRSLRKAPTPTSAPPPVASEDLGALAVLHNRPFLLLWLAQLSTQVGGNMVIFGLATIINHSYHSNIAVGALFLSFLVPAIIFSALAGVFVDRVDKRHMLVVTNIIRGFLYLAVVVVGDNLLLLYLLMILVSTVTTFFGPAEASMIPFLVPRKQWLAANGLFTLTMNVAFALGFALLGPFVIALASGQALIVIVGALYFVAAVFCWTLPSSPAASRAATPGQTVADAERAVETMLGQFVEGINYIRQHRNVGWSLSYLGITGALVGILGTLGPGFATKTVGLGDTDFALIVLPLGLGIVMGILFLNSYGRYLPRRRTIEAGMIGIGVLLALLSIVEPISHFLVAQAASTGLSEASRLVSLLALVMGIAFLVGAGYVVVAISAQTELQEELPEDVRGRVFGVLGMLVSIASLAPIIIVAPVADLIGREPVIFASGVVVLLWGISSVVRRGALALADVARVPSASSGVPVDPVTTAMSSSDRAAVAVSNIEPSGEGKRSKASGSARGEAVEHKETR